MAYMNQEKKATIAQLVKPILKKYGLKGTLSVNNHMTIVLSIKSGELFWDVDGRYDDVNIYHLDSNYTGKELECLEELKEALNFNNHDNSDVMTDYFDVGHYVDITLGKWNKPYEYTGAPKVFPNGYTVEQVGDNSFTEVVRIKKNGEYYCHIKREDTVPYHYQVLVEGLTGYYGEDRIKVKLIEAVVNDEIHVPTKGE